MSRGPEAVTQPPPGSVTAIRSAGRNDLDTDAASMGGHQSPGDLQSLKDQVAMRIVPFPAQATLPSRGPPQVLRMAASSRDRMARFRRADWLG